MRWASTYGSRRDLEPAPDPSQPEVVSACSCSRTAWKLGRVTADCRCRHARCCRVAPEHVPRPFSVLAIRTADWMIIGEAPGAGRGPPWRTIRRPRREAARRNAIAPSGIRSRDACSSPTSLKCRPPNNRDPKPEDEVVARAAPYLERQIQLVQPKIILAVGRIAAQKLLLDTDAPARPTSAVRQHQLERWDFAAGRDVSPRLPPCAARRRNASPGTTFAWRVVSPRR